MVAIKEAVKTAEQTLANLFANAQGVQLEEILLGDDENFWQVTLSYLAPFSENEVAPRLAYSHLLGPEFEALGGTTPRMLRKYKTFEIDRKTGTFRQMKIRTIPSA